ncbi:2-oxo-4-hydroxy-4-carboxy-5-ureidoimidazoline decarboxylase [Bacterioplanoides sp.]|uniref:2-oxo-4-hydroxy-4-carboxy-5-ureidoimidazoline decarboxylase n=1 Tax=Bacterioplanoides sp. TaxID=2066072 RepID=UPI003B5CAAE2
MADLTYTVEQLNQLNEQDAAFAFENCCTSKNWIEGMVAARPYANVEQCLSVAETVWSKLGESDFLQAFEGHPKIGDVSSLKAKYAHTKKLASGEQSSVNEASDEVIERLAKGNNDYHDKNGFIFIVCATGKSAAEMLELLEQRLPNSREQELVNAAAEQAKITAIRINKLLPEE